MPSARPWPAIWLALALWPSVAAAQVPAKSVERQIADATSPLPDALRPGAQVLGYQGDRLVLLRAGTNGMICLADAPAAKGFHTACYHRALEPFMARGRALKTEGRAKAAVDSIRAAEIAAGTLAMPDAPAALYSIFHDDDGFDPSAGVPPGTPGLYVVYLPYATEATTGISATPARDRPWLMSPGTPWAHVMVNR